MGSALLPGPRIPILRDGLLKARKGEERERENRRTERSKHTQRDRERKTHRERQRERENRRTERSKHTERERHRKIEMYTDSLLLHGYVCGPLTASFICFILFILCSTSCLLACLLSFALRSVLFLVTFHTASLASLRSVSPSIQHPTVRTISWPLTTWRVRWFGCAVVS